MSTEKNKKKEKIEVWCITNQTKYESMLEAAKKLGLSQGNIRSCCLGRQAHTFGFQFQYYKDYEKGNAPPYKKKETKRQEEVICINTGLIYPSIAEAAQQLHLRYSGIYSCCMDKNYSHYGLSFQFYREYLDQKPRLAQPKRTRKVTCIETGITYNSIVEAARDTKSKATAICKCCRGDRLTVNSYHWKYADERKQKNIS